MSYITEDEVLDALPDENSFLREYVDYASARTDAHALFHLAGAISLLSQAAPIDLHVPLFGSRVHANTYALIVAPSTVGRKTQSVKIATGIARDAIERKSGKNGQPLVRDFLASTPGSSEALIDSFSDMPQQLLTYEEFGAFLQASQGDGATNSFAKIRTVLTDIYDGSSVGRSTVKQKRKNVTNPRLSVMAAVATDFLEAYTTTTDWTAGFLARFLTFHVADTYYASEDRRVMKLAEEDPGHRAYIVERFINLKNRMGQFNHCIGLDPGARELWDIWEAHRTNAAKSASSLVQAGMHRADVFALKIALLLALDKGKPYGGGLWRIGEDDLGMAMQIADLHLKSITSLSERIVFASRDMQDRRNVLAKIDEAGATGISLGDLCEMTHLLVGQRMNTIIATLIEQKRILRRIVDGQTMYFPTGKK